RRAAYPRLPIRVKQPLEALARTPAPLGEIADDAGDTKPLPLGARTAQMLHDCHFFTSSESRLPSSTKSSVRYSRSAHSIASRVSACTSTSCRGTPASHEALTSSVHISFAPCKSGARKQLSLAIAKQPERSIVDRL